MRENEIFFEDDLPIPKDSRGNIYSHSNMNHEEILEAIDDLLEPHGLELLVGNSGSNDYFFCIVERMNLL